MQGEELKLKLEEAHNIAIFGHQSIDWDALWSMFWLWLQLEKFWKNVSYFTPDTPSDAFLFLPIQDLKTEFDYRDYDLICFVDFSTYNMIKKFTHWHEEYFDKQQKIIIDHHIFSKELPNSIEFRDDTSISAAQLVFELTQQWWSNLIDSQIATFMLTWIMTDSGNFRFDEGEESIRVSRNNLALLEKWAKKKQIIDNVFRSKSYEDLEFMQVILWRMQKVDDIIYSRYSQSELEKFWLHPDSADYALYLIWDIKDQQLVILWKEKDDHIKFSLRGKWRYNCRDIAKYFGWWWHANAAWCSTEKSWNLENDVLNFVGKVKNLIK
jgi:phosphoesterase RecJ-like protein